MVTSESRGCVKVIDFMVRNLSKVALEAIRKRENIKCILNK